MSRPQYLAVKMGENRSFRQTPSGQMQTALETVATIIRITGGNFPLLNRVLTQIERILEINALQQVTKTVVKNGRESLVIGQA